MVTVAFALLIAFQNCSKVGLDPASTSNAIQPTDDTGGGNSNPNDPTDPAMGMPSSPTMTTLPSTTGTTLPTTMTTMPSSTPTTMPGPVACDPFTTSPTNQCDTTSTAGLIGAVYYLPNGVGVQNYIDHGEKLNLTVLLGNLNIAPRSWLDGFPDEGNQLLREADGSILNEYFALDLTGKIQLPSSMSEGMYQFGLLSDDGAILDIDGQTIVNDDGTHAAKWKCGALVGLKHNESHQIRVRYYQGPREQIALQMFWRQASKQNMPCNTNGALQIVPVQALSH